MEGDCTSREQLIERHFNEGYKHGEIIDILSSRHSISLSIRHLKRILQSAGLKRRNIPESPLEEIVAAVVEEIECSGSCLGYKTLWRRLRSTYNLAVKRNSVLKILRIVDPEGVKTRAIHRLRRRKYSVPGPNFLWHVDGYDKLKPFGFAIHGCIDGLSRKIIWLEVATSNNDPKIVAYYFLNAVKKRKCLPTMIRSDRGTENTLIECLQVSLRMDHTDKLAGTKSFITGKSTSNQRIESYWSQLRKLGIDFWITLFKAMRDSNLFNDSNPLHVHALRYCFGPLITYDLENIRLEWNNHPIRRQRNSNLLYGKPNYMYYCPEKFGKKNYGKKVTDMDLDVCSMNYSTKPDLCDSKFDELVKLLLPNSAPATTIDSAAKLYEELTDAFDLIHD